MFYADLFVNAEFVGFIDSDSLFITPVMPEDLFDGLGRPKVLSQVGQPINDWWHGVPAATFKALQLLEASSVFK
jgi:hypothetical protein